MSNEIERRVTKLEAVSFPPPPTVYLFGDNKEDLARKIAAAEAQYPGRPIVGYRWLELEGNAG